MKTTKQITLITNETYNYDDKYPIKLIQIEHITYVLEKTIELNLTTNINTFAIFKCAAYMNKYIHFCKISVGN